LLPDAAADPGDALTDPVWGAVLGAGVGAAAAVDVGDACAVVFDVVVAAGPVSAAVAGVFVRGFGNSA